MRILVVSQYFWPENFRINDLASALVERGHEVVVLTGYPNYPEGSVFPEYLNDPDRFSSYLGVDIVRVPMIPRGKSSMMLALNYISYALSACTLGVWKLRSVKFDAIFVFQTSPVTVGIPAALMRYLKNAPVAFWILDLWPESLSAVGVIKSKVILQAVGRLVSFIYDHCDLILVQSKSFIPQITHYLDNIQKVRYFPNWAEAIFSGSAVTPAPEIECSQDTFNIMFAGNIGDAQDFPTILRAAELLRTNAKVRWLIVGDGRMLDWVRAEVSRLKLETCVHLLGRYPVERMPSFYKHADALLVSLKDEPIFGMTIPGKLQSYLSFGLPILAMLNGEGAEVVREAKAGLACPAGDAQGLVKAVLKLIDTPKSIRDQMGIDGQAFCSREFNRNLLVARLESWLVGLCASKRSIKETH